MPTITTNDRTTLFYRDVGEGRPVVFLASWGLSSAMWQYQIAHLAARGVRCIAYDRRGHGRSDDPGRGYDYDTLADDLAALLEQLDLDDVVLIGHSMAGGEIIRYLTRHGDARIAGVLLLAPTLPFPLKTPDNPEGLEPHMFEATRALWMEDYPAWLTANAGPYFGEGVPGCSVSWELVEWTRHDMMQPSLSTLIACNHSMVETDFRDELTRVRVPVLIVHGTVDRSAPLELTGQRTAALIPGARLIVYEGGPHGLYLTHRERFNAAIEAFADACMAAGRT